MIQPKPQANLDNNTDYVLELEMFSMKKRDPSDKTGRPFGRPICYNVMNLQLGNYPIVAVRLRPTTNNNYTQTNYMQLATKLWVQIQTQLNIFLFEFVQLGEQLMMPRLA